MVFIYAVRQRKWFCIANQWSKSVSYLSSFFWIINTITDDNNSRVSYACHSLSCFYLSTKNVHKSCTFLLFAFTKFSHMSSYFFRVLTCYNPCSYPMTLFLHSCAIEECIRNIIFFFLFWMQAGLRLARALFFFFILICPFSISYNLYACFALFCFACLFCDFTNSERCFAILRANTNYNFLIYGNDFTQIQEIRTHCRRRRLF